MTATAPVRVADVGGWTDTWFGAPGRVCSVAVGPGAEVRAEVVERSGGERATGGDRVLVDPGGGASTDAGRAEAPVRLVALALDVDLAIGPGPERGWRAPTPGVEPLLEHGVGSVLGEVEIPAGFGIDISISSPVPPGASLGTSASVVVALLAALRALVSDRPTPERLAVAAHEVETVRAGRQAGVQDQWAAALGGVVDLVVGPYPEVRAAAVAVPAPALVGLQERLVTVAFGAHNSSAVHQEVIMAITSCGGEEHERARSTLRRLSVLAGAAVEALGAGDLERWGEVLVEATAAQERLHPALIGPAHRRAMSVAESLGCSGWKVNGAGGVGGSLSVLAPAGPGRALAVAEAMAGLPGAQVLGLRPWPGVEVLVEEPPEH